MSNLIRSLEEYHIYKKEILILSDEIRELSELDPVEGADSIKLSEVINILNDRINKYHDAALRVEAAIDSIEDETEKLVLILHYGKGITMKETADTLGYSLRMTYKYLRRAKDHLSLSIR